MRIILRVMVLLVEGRVSAFRFSGQRTVVMVLVGGGNFVNTTALQFGDF